MTGMSADCDNPDSDDSNTLLVEINEREYLFISGVEIIKFATEDKIIDYIPNMCKNMIPYAKIF